MYLTRICLAGLLLSPAVAFAQCANPTTLVCVTPSGCNLEIPAGYNVGISGQDAPGGPKPITCCGDPVPGYVTLGGDCLYSKVLSEPPMKKVMASLSVHNPLLLVACDGDLIPFSGSIAHQQQWSAKRALSSYNIKLQTQTR